MTDRRRGPRVIVALDCASADEARALAGRFSPGQCRLKIGLELYTAAGPSLVTQLAARGFDVFLDLKYHDIPNTVARACASAARLGVWMLTVHTLGGPQMLAAARAALEPFTDRPLLAGVTVLTSMSQSETAAIGLAATPAEQVSRLAGLAQAAGLDGVVCSPLEAAALRAQCGPHFVLVTPGVRPAGVSADDQRRTLPPAEAVAAGADYLVIGRPVTAARDPGAALQAITSSLEAA